MKQNIGLFISRLQPFHLGHKFVIDKMLEECEMVIIGLGSTQSLKNISTEDKEKFISRNPFNTDTRVKMLENVYGKTGKYSKIKIIKLNDIGASSKEDWIGYVYKTILKNNLPLPTKYFTGSEEDASWMFTFNRKMLELEERKLLTEVNIIKRGENSPEISGTMIKNSFLNYDKKWMEMVPKINIQIVEELFNDIIDWVPENEEEIIEYSGNEIKELLNLIR